MATTTTSSSSSTTTPLNTSSSSSSVPSSSLSSSSSSGSKRGGVPFHHRPSYPAPARATNTAVSGKENATAVIPPASGSVEGVQDRANRSVENTNRHKQNKILQNRLLLLPPTNHPKKASLFFRRQKTKKEPKLLLFYENKQNTYSKTNSLRCPRALLCVMLSAPCVVSAFMSC